MKQTTIRIEIRKYEFTIIYNNFFSLELKVLIVEQREQRRIATVREDDAVNFVFGQFFLLEFAAFTTTDRRQGSGGI